MTFFISVVQKKKKIQTDEYECSGYNSPPNITVLNYILKPSLNAMLRL